MTTFEITISQFIKATAEYTYNITCEPEDLESMVDNLIEELDQDCVNETDVVLVNTFIEDIEADKSSNKPTLINTKILK